MQGGCLVGGLRALGGCGGSGRVATAGFGPVRGSPRERRSLGALASPRPRPGRTRHTTTNPHLCPRRPPQECLRDARRVEAITGQQEDRDNYVVPARWAAACACLGGACAAAAAGCRAPLPPLPRCRCCCGLALQALGCPAACARPQPRRPFHLTALPPPSPPPPPTCCSQLEERCRDLDITDLQPFFQSEAFREAGFRLADGGAQVLLARA